MKEKLKSIQSSIALAFSSFFIIVIIGLWTVSYTLTEDTAKNISISNTYLLIDQVHRNIISYVEYMKHISSIVYTNKDVQEYFYSYDRLSADDRKKNREKIVGLFRSIQQTRIDINLIMLLGYKGGYISNRGNKEIKEYIDYKKQEWYQNAFQGKGNTVISPSHVQNLFYKEFRWVVSLSSEIYTPDKTPLGILLVDLNFNIIEDLCKNIHQGKSGYIFIVDESGRIIYHPEQQLIYNNLKMEMIDKVITTSDGSFVINDGGIKKIYTIKSLQDPRWKIVGVTYLNELIENKDRIQLYYVILGVISVFIIVIISIFISRKISKPIKDLRSSIKEVENGNFDININVQSTNEIGELEKDFKIMIFKIKDLMKQILKEQDQKRIIELKALQDQINPHFLYNTLDSIIWLAANKKNKAVLDMTSALSKLFRIGISRGDQIITIENEIEHITSYLTIQKMRYKDKFDYSITVSPDIMQMKTVKLILQPIVENAIYHGIKNKKGKGHIGITGEKKEDEIVFLVMDDGVGMTKEKIDRLFLPKKTDSNPSGIGINNVNDRIRLYFGSKYGIGCTSSVDKGTVIEIHLPQIKETHNEE
jgi:two-component system, sensor histidine kinase YesM